MKNSRLEASDKDFWVPEEFDWNTQMAYGAGFSHALHCVSVRFQKMHRDGEMPSEVASKVLDQLFELASQIGKFYEESKLKANV